MYLYKISNLTHNNDKEKGGNFFLRFSVFIFCAKIDKKNNLEKEVEK